MKASELRIGNLIRLNREMEWSNPLSEKTVKIESISTQGINYSNYPEMGVCWDTLDDKFVGIPLTEEWLLKFGFQYQDETKILFIQVGNLLHIEFEDMDCSITPTTWSGSSILPWMDIEYVHQLQNLYYALTGTELELKA